MMDTTHDPLIRSLDAPLPDRIAGAQVDRDPRVRFKHPVRVVPIGGPPRAYRVLSANLSRDGMFLKMPTPFDMGTKVALSLEAGGRVLPFAQAEVVWRDLAEVKAEGRHAGFGVKFTGFLHPRAHELVDFLVKNLETGKPLSVDPARPSWRRWLVWGAAGVAATILGAAITSGALRMLRAPDEAAPVAVAPAVVEVPTLLDAQVEIEAAPAPVAPVVVAPEPIDAREVAESLHGPQAEAVAAPDPRPSPPAVVERKPSFAIPTGAVRSVSASLEPTQLRLTLSLAPGAEIVRAFTLRGPDRLAIDVRGAAPKKTYVLGGAADLGKLRVGRLPKGTRIVLDLARAPGAPVVVAGNSVSLPLK